MKKNIFFLIIYPYFLFSQGMTINKLDSTIVKNVNSLKKYIKENEGFGRFLIFYDFDEVGN